MTSSDEHLLKHSVYKVARIDSITANTSTGADDNFLLLHTYTYSVPNNKNLICTLFSEHSPYLRGAGFMRPRLPCAILYHRRASVILKVLAVVSGQRLKVRGTAGDRYQSLLIRRQVTEV